MRIINADKLKEHFKEYTTHSGIQASLDRYALKVIEEEPTVDAVPVIRCRECKYKPTCEEYIITQQEDAYCSWADRAERKEECSR